MRKSGRIPLTIPLTDFIPFFEHKKAGDFSPAESRFGQSFQRIQTGAGARFLLAIWQRAGKAARAIRANAGCSLVGGCHRSAPGSWRPMRPVARSGRGFAGGGYVRMVMCTEQHLIFAHWSAPSSRKAHVPAQRSWSYRPAESYLAAWE